MFRRVQGLFAFAFVALLAGCATTTGTRNYQTDIDSLNARVSALQGQLSAKDQEIAALQNKMNEQDSARASAEAALRNAENEKRALADRLADAASQAKKAPESDLK